MCFLDVGTNQQEALKLLQTLRKALIPVIALHTSNDPGAYSQLFARRRRRVPLPAGQG